MVGRSHFSLANVGAGSLCLIFSEAWIIHIEGDQYRGTTEAEKLKMGRRSKEGGMTKEGAVIDGIPEAVQYIECVKRVGACAYDLEYLGRLQDLSPITLLVLLTELPGERLCKGGRAGFLLYLASVRPSHVPRRPASLSLMCWFREQNHDMSSSHQVHPQYDKPRRISRRRTKKVIFKTLFWDVWSCNSVHARHPGTCSVAENRLTARFVPAWHESLCI